MIKFVYWSTTALLALGLLSGAYFNLTRAPQIVESMQALGYPLVVAGLLGFWKLMAVPALLAPGLVRLKEWAYAGCFFCFTGALASHLAVNDGKFAAPAVFIALTLISWATRPASRGGALGA